MIRTAVIAAVLSGAAMLAGILGAEAWHDRVVDARVTAVREEMAQACREERLQAVADAEAAVRAQAAIDIEAARQAGQAREVVRDRIVTRYITLRKEAARAPAHPVDRCELPADRLRRWTGANAAPAGAPDRGAAAAEPGAAAAAPAGAGLRAHAGPGGEPPRRDRGLSPGGEPAVRIDRARDAGPTTGGLRPVDGE